MRNKGKITWTLALAAGMALVLNSCYNDKYDKLYSVTPVVTTCDTTTVTYTHDIMPILTTYCTISGGCHDAAGASTSGYDFTTYQGIQPVAQTLLIGDINWEPGHNAMPKNGSKLSDCNINKFTRWVNQGALNN